MRRYFITGGEGFIGYHLCRELASRPEREAVTYDARKHFVAPEDSYWDVYHPYRLADLGDDVTRVHGDVTNRTRLVEHLERHQPDVVVHLAALPITTVADDRPAVARRDILDATAILLDAVRDADVDLDRFVYVSSSMVYGDFDRDDDGEIVPASETDDCEPLSLYGSMKLGGEHVTRAYGDRFDVPYTIVRPSAVYGPTDCNRRVTEIFLTRALRGDPLRLDNGGHHELDFTYVEDLARGLVLAAEHDNALGETFNLTAGDGRSVRELAEVIADHVPGTETYVEYKDRDRPDRGTLDVSKARDRLGYEPEYSLEDGVAAYLEFVESNGFADEIRA